MTTTPDPIAPGTAARQVQFDTERRTVKVYKSTTGKTTLAVSNKGAGPFDTSMLVVLDEKNRQLLVDALSGVERRVAPDLIPGRKYLVEGPAVYRIYSNPTPRGCGSISTGDVVLLSSEDPKVDDIGDVFVKSLQGTDLGAVQASSLTLLPVEPLQVGGLARVKANETGSNFRAGAVVRVTKVEGPGEYDMVDVEFLDTLANEHASGHGWYAKRFEPITVGDLTEADKARMADRLLGVFA